MFSSDLRPDLAAIQPMQLDPVRCIDRALGSLSNLKADVGQ
jgi:hypothetical protein